MSRVRTAIKQASSLDVPRFVGVSSEIEAIALWLVCSSLERDTDWLQPDAVYDNSSPHSQRQTSSSNY